MMKISFLFGTMQRGGAERVIAQLANHFVGMGDAVSIITMDSSSSAYGLNDNVQHTKLNVAYPTNNVTKAVRRNYLSMQKLREEIKRIKPDVVVAFSLREALHLLFAFPTGRSFKIVASERNNPRFSRKGRLEIIAIKIFLPMIDGFVFQTQKVTELFPKSLQRKGVVIPNGIFSELLPEHLPDFNNRKHNRICSVGRLTAQKGYDVLLKAFSRFLDTHSGYEMHIYGEGVQRDMITAMSSQLHIADSVFLHGSIPDVVSKIADAGMYVLASRFEGMPNSLIEAMACGLPCIATDCDYGPKELIVNGINGLLVPVEDDIELAKAMAAIATNIDFAEQLSKNAINVRNTHSGERIAMLYYNYLHDVIAR